MPNVKVEDNSIINRAIIATGVTVGEGTSIGNVEEISLVAEDISKVISYHEEKYSLG